MTAIRSAVPEDIEQVARLEQECLGDDAWSEGLVREGIKGDLPTITYLVAELDGEVVGHAVTSSAGDIAELQRIAVSESHRRRGVAARLLAGSSTRPVARQRTGCSSRSARTTGPRWRSTPDRGSSRSTGGRATTATAPPRSSCVAPSSEAAAAPSYPARTAQGR